MRVNLGCGDQYAAGWTNIDFGSPHRKDEEVDLTGDLPWKSDSITHVYAGHVLEHLARGQCRLLLYRLRRCVVMSGEIMVIGPDVDIAQRMADAGTLDVTMDSLRFGAGRWSGDVHQWECTSAEIAKLLDEAGWGDIKEMKINDVPEVWPVAYRGPQWQCAVSARKVG